jgi:hypothetical protein
MREFEDYLKKMGIRSGSLLSHLESRYTVVSGICPEEIESLFISQSFSPESEIVHDSMWLFSQNYCAEVKQVLSQEWHWDLTNLSNGIQWVDVKSESYNYDRADSSSRLLVTAAFGSRLTMELKAIGESCDDLLRILRNHLTPFLRTR